MTELLGVTSFPVKIYASGGDVSVDLHADGSWTGDGQAFLDALASNPPRAPANNIVIVWLVAQAIRSSLKPLVK